MAAQRNPKHKKLAAKPDKDTTVAIKKAKVEAKITSARAKAAERTKLISKEALAEAQKASRAAQAKVVQERQARVRRVSFVVRLTVDEHGQPGRTEIEHVASRRRQNFSSPNGERLVAFMQACISPTIVSEHTIPAAPPAKKVGALTPGPFRPKSSLIVSDVRVFRPRAPDFMTLTPTPEEPFVVQARFQLQSFEAPSLTALESTYEMKVYANELTSGKSKLLTTYSANLIQDVLEYVAPAEVPGLQPGLYRLFTVITLGAPIKMAGCHTKTIIHVI